MSTVLTRSPRPRAPIVRNIAALIGGALLFAIIMAVLLTFMRSPTSVERVTITNPHPWIVSVDVTGGERDGWLGLGPIGRESEQTFRDVIDQGDEWVFRFAYSGEELEVRIPRHELERNGWSVTVPEEFAEQLKAAGVRESAG